MIHGWSRRQGHEENTHSTLNAGDEGLVRFSQACTFAKAQTSECVITH